MSAVVVTIDGPAGSGKSTVATVLAERLGVPHVDTGAFYRAATLAVLRAGVDPEDADGCAAVVVDRDIRREGRRTLLDGVDVEAEIRGAEVTGAVSAVSKHQRVRDALVALQRQQVGARGAVLEGRDAGTAVAPDADLKVWLTASVRERAARRAAQLGRDDPAEVERQALEIARRDADDAARMMPAADAVRIDTSGRRIDAVVAELEALARASARGRT